VSGTAGRVRQSDWALGCRPAWQDGRWNGGGGGGISSASSRARRYRGFYEGEWMVLQPENVSRIHSLGGTILGSSRGGMEVEK